MAYSIIIVSRNAIPKPTNHPFEAGRVSTIALIFSVTVTAEGVARLDYWSSFRIDRCFGIARP